MPKEIKNGDQTQMNRMYLMLVSITPVVCIFLLFGFVSQVLAEQNEFRPYLSKAEMSQLLPNTFVNEPRYKLSFKGTFRSAYEPGIYHFKIKDVNVGWKGSKVFPDFDLMFSFRHQSGESSKYKSISLDSNESGLFKQQMDKQNGLFFMSIGKSW